MLYNDKQNAVRVFDNKYRPKVIICDGAIGSGKTRIMVSCWLADQWEKRHRRWDFIMTGYTLSSLERNILRPLHDDFEVDANLDSENAFELYGNRVYCFGTDDAHSWKPIRGIQEAHGHYGNEITLSHPLALDEVANRCRGKETRYFLETNPDGENHPVHRLYIAPAVKHGNTAKLARFNFTMWDNDRHHNGFLPDDYIQQQEERYSGIMRRKYLAGEWCSIEGQIYYPERLQFYDDSVITDKAWYTGAVVKGYLDPAAGSQKKTGCFTSIITGAEKDGRIYIMDAFVRKVGVAGIIEGAGERLKKWNYAAFKYEDNFTQDEYVGTPLKQAYPFAPITGQSSREDKLSRLVGMQNTVEKKVLFPKRFLDEKNSDGWLLLQQLFNITATRDERAMDDTMFLDAPDALEGLIRAFSKGRGAAVGTPEKDYGKPVDNRW